MIKTKIEIAARKLCELRGFDPDELIGHGAEPNEYGVVTLQLLYSPRWELVAREIRARVQVDQALAFAGLMGRNWE